MEKLSFNLSGVNCNGQIETYYLYFSRLNNNRQYFFIGNDINGIT